MSEKRFQIYGCMVEDTLGIIPSTLWQNEEQQQKYCDEMNKLHDENQQLKEKLYVKENNTMEVVKDYSKQFKRHTAEFSFMMDLAEDLGVNVRILEALDD